MNSTSIDQFALSDEQISDLEKIATVIEPLLERDLGPERRRELRTQACVTLNIGERTLRSLKNRFKSGGLLALLRKKRKDAGILRRFDPALIPKAVSLLQENPHRSAERVLQMLREDSALGSAANKISASCLYHRLVESGVDFKELRATLPRRPFLSFQAVHPCQLWQGDARHGISLPHPERTGQERKTFLFAWIDDFSRLVLHAQYYWDEKLPRLEDCFRQAVLKYGLPDTVYVDNGAVYKSNQFLFILNDCQVKKTHHPPYRAWCKGKVEALMKAFKKFQAEAELAAVQTLDELNSALAAWIDVEHNRKIHSQTGETPLARFIAGVEKRPPRRITDLEKFNNSFLCRLKRIVNPHGRINFCSNQYLASGIAPGTPLDLRYDPFDLSRLYLFEGGLCVRTFCAHTLSRDQAPGIPEEKKKSARVVSRESTEYFSRLREQHLKNIALHTGTRAFSDLKNQNKGTSNA